MKLIDVVIPTLSQPDPGLLDDLDHVSGIGNVIITREKPLSIARKKAILKAESSLVALIDDDIRIPHSWLNKLKSEMVDRVGAVSSVAANKDPDKDAYLKIVSCFFNLDSVDTSPHINNVLVRKEIFENYNPPLLFLGEDFFFKKHVEKTHIWKVLPFFGVQHLKKSSNFVGLGYAYKKYNHYSTKQLIRRAVSKFVFIPYAAALNLSFKTAFNLHRENSHFYAGVFKQIFEGK